jgi:hypothetical protein
MARAVETYSEAVWYAPDIDGNRGDPEPFAVKIKPMTARDAAAIERAIASGKVLGATDGEIAERVAAIEREFVVRQVVEVTGYSVTDEATGETLRPTNGEQLIAAVDRAPASERVVLRDIVAAIDSRSHLSEGYRGKSVAPSDSGQAATQVGSGVAANAAGAKKASCQKPNGAGSVTATATITPIWGSGSTQAADGALGLT